jgi:hypothetical protein
VAVQVTKHTDNTVWVQLAKGNVRMSRRTAADEKYWPTWGEARAYLGATLESHIRSAEERLASYRKMLATLAALREP